MDAQRIQYLAQFIPDTSDYFRYSLSSFGDQTSSHQRQIDRFLVAYRDLSFGYHFVRALVKDNIDLPPDVSEQEIIDFYWFEKTGEPSDALIQSLSISHPSSHFLENSLQAMLLTGAPFSEISRVTGISTDVIKTYERLFFNVYDRREESLFIANVVYPEHRLVETMEGYIKEADAGSVLKRSAYNNGLDDVAYFIGLKVESIEGSLAGGNAQEMANRLESSIMANGYYLARNGFLNQRSSSGVASAKSLLVAAKQGGDDGGEQDSYGATSIGDSLVEELQRVKGAEVRKRIETQQDISIDEANAEDAACIADED